VVTQRTEGATIRFDAALSTIDTSTVLRLPETASKNLRSRGQVAVHGTINGVEFQTVLEPDGNFGHWMRVDDTLQHAAGISTGDTATLDVEGDQGLARAERAPGSCDSSGRCPAEDPEPVERDYPDGALGMGSLGQRHEEP
jgi:uncharacterized protein DUF1905